MCVCVCVCVCVKMNKSQYYFYVVYFRSYFIVRRKKNCGKE